MTKLFAFGRSEYVIIWKSKIRCLLNIRDFFLIYIYEIWYRSEYWFVKACLSHANIEFINYSQGGAWIGNWKRKTTSLISRKRFDLNISERLPNLELDNIDMFRFVIRRKSFFYDPIFRHVRRSKQSRITTNTVTVETIRMSSSYTNINIHFFTLSKRWEGLTNPDNGTHWMSKQRIIL